MAYDRAWVISADHDCTFTVDRDGSTVTTFSFVPGTPYHITSPGRALADTPTFPEFQRIVANLAEWFRLVVKTRQLALPPATSYEFECTREAAGGGVHKVKTKVKLGPLVLNAWWRSNTDVVTVDPRGDMNITISEFREWAMGLQDLVTNVHIIQQYARA